MNIAKQRKAMDAALDEYRAWLDAIPDDDFTVTPPGGGWSYAEVYSHILKSTLGSLMALERCGSKNSGPSAKGANFFGRILLFAGTFPPVKIKVPQSVTDKIPALKIDKEEARNMLIKCRKRIEEMEPLAKSLPAGARYKHPRMGMLNAAQWFKFIRIHLQHHLKQLARTKKKLRQTETF